MTLFHYQAYQADGRVVQGTLEAEDLPSLEARLHSLGLWLIRTQNGRQQGQGEGQRDARWKVSRTEKIQFYIQMALLLRAGITLPHALERLSLDQKEGKLGPVLRGLHEEIILGTPLHVALQRYPKVFGPEAEAMLEAGEVSGQLPEVFENLSADLEWTDRLQADLRQALIYPAMVLTAAAGLILLLFTVVVPRFVGLLTDLNLAVPLLTRVVMQLSSLLVQGWMIWVPLVLAIPLALHAALRHPPTQLRLHRALMDAPVFGELYSMFGYARFAQLLAMLVRANLPLLRGLEICEPLTGNAALQEALRRTRLRLIEGTPFHRALGEQNLFPSTLLTMIATGESSGKLDFALQSAADYYNKVIPRRIKVIFGLFDPLMMVSLIAVVGTVALSVMLPILQLWQAS